MQESTQITRKQIIDTGLVFVLACIFIYIKWDFNPGLWISIGLIVISLIFPILLFPLAYMWFGLAKILNWFTSRLLLSILFFQLVTPVALIRKLMGKDSLQLKAFKKNKPSAFMQKNRKITVADMKYPF